MSNTKLGAMVITSHKIIGTTVRVYTAWEPYAGHGVITHIDGVRMGRVGTAQLPEHLNKLPARSTERYNAVKGWHQAQYQRAYALICEAHPEAKTGRPDMGEIEVLGAE